MHDMNGSPVRVPVPPPRPLIARAARALLLAGALAASLAARAQAPSSGDQAAANQPAAANDQATGSNGAGANGAPLQEVLITGSRIPVPANITSTSPITTVTAQDIQLQGQTDTIDVINALPQNVIDSSADYGNNSNPLSVAGGTTTADLRGLGPQRTLVLVDGKRLGDGDPNTANPNPAPDLDQIPAALIERIDVVTGGASAVYGSDAMAGVINFVLKKNFQGVQIDGQYGFYQHDNGDSAIQAQENALGATNAGNSGPSGSVMDGYKRDLSVVAGTNTADGDGNVTGYFTYHKQDPVPGSQRDFADCELVTPAALGIPDTRSLECLGNSNSNQFVVGGTPYTVSGNSLLPWPQAGTSPPAEFNSNAYDYQQRQDERYNAGFLAHVDLNQWAKPYLDFSFMNDRTAELEGPSGLFEGLNPYNADGGYRINCSNPLLSAQEQSVIGCTSAMISADAADPGSQLADVDIGRRNIEGGGRLDAYEHTNFRVVFGVKGEVIDGWSYDAYGQYSYTSLFNSNLNYLNYQSINNALLVTGTAAAPTCISGPPCVPYNIFSTGGVTPAQLAYLYSPGTAYGTNSEQIVHADFTGDLGTYGIRSALAHDAVGVNVGAEHRLETLSFAPDGEELSGNLAGFSGAAVPIDDSYAVSEGFTEIRAPLIQDRPWIRDLDLDAGYRYSSYSTAGVTNTYKFEVQYSPSPDFRLRYSYDRAVRAPNLIELYNPQSYSGQDFVATDPCAGATPTRSLAQCEHTGVSPAQYGSIPQCPANECGQVLGGNPLLKPEEA
ncbi:MAG TPA: TonB-dependent receptor, partial [Steroidobacteraceae bacterium]|nr:TonB-dependent receptor [Steroidobacteraceae bacterium]